MICVSVMLAIFLAWPMVFGSEKSSAVKAAAAPVVASVAKPAADARLVRTAVKPAQPPAARVLESCFKRYEREYARCGSTNSACRMNVADRWDLCEATGFWPS